MKKSILALAAALFLGPWTPAQAIELGDQIKLTLLDHVMAVGQIRDEGDQMAFVDSIVMIGKHNGYSIFDIQGGFTGAVKPETVDELGIKWVGQGFLKFHPFLRDKVNLADHWAFLNALEYGAVAGYDFTEKDTYVGLQFGLAFQAKPKE